MKLPLNVDLKDKVIVVTGAGGVLCSMFSKALAKTGAKIALLDRNLEAAQENVKQIVEDGGTAKAYQVDVLSKESLQNAHDEIVKDLGTCDILINGEKVIGGAMIEYNGLLIVVFQINFVNKREDIINICGITPKIPGCIDSSVVTAEQIKNEFLSWLTL